MRTASEPESTPEQAGLIFRFNQQASNLANKISNAILKPMVKIRSLYGRSPPEYIHEV